MSEPDVAAWTRKQVEDIKALAVAVMACAEVRDGHWFDEEDEITDDNGLRLATVNSPPVTSHIAANDPRSVIADLEAKLAILDEHKGVTSEYGGSGFKTGEMACASCGADDGWWGVAYPCRTVLLLAAGYRHRPGYQQAWKPDKTG
jgi:hypothetical protein